MEKYSFAGDCIHFHGRFTWDCLYLRDSWSPVKATAGTLFFSCIWTLGNVMLSKCFKCIHQSWYKLEPATSAKQTAGLLHGFTSLCRKQFVHRKWNTNYSNTKLALFSTIWDNISQFNPRTTAFSWCFWGLKCLLFNCLWISFQDELLKSYEGLNHLFYGYFFHTYELR